MSRVTEAEVAEAVTKVLADRATGRATIKELVEEIPNYLTLSVEDLAPSPTRPGEAVWEQQVRNITSHKASKEQVLVCMGPPASKAAEGQTEVWSYNSGDGTTIASGSVSQGSFSGVSSRRFCQINVVMSGGAVSAVNYQGPTGGLITAGEQCAYAVDACVKPRS